MARNEKGEDIQKFLKEMPEVAGLIRKQVDPVINRKMARASGEKNAEEFRKKQAEEDQKTLKEMRLQADFKAYTICKWYDDIMKVKRPLAFKVAKRFNWTWLFRYLGYKFYSKNENRFETTENPRGTKITPYTIATIYWRNWNFLSYSIKNEITWNFQEPLRRDKNVRTH